MRFKYRPRRDLGDPVTVAALLLVLVLAVVVGAFAVVLLYAP